MSDHETARETTREGGFSLLEVIIGATILFMIIGVAGKFITTSTSLLSTVTARTESEQTAARIADRLARLFRNASIASMKYNYVPTSTFADGATNTSLYLRVISENTGVPVYGDGYYLFPAVDEVSYTDSVDNDKDSRTDEVCLKMCTIPALLHTSQTDPAAGAPFNNLWYSRAEKVAEIRWVNTLPQYPPAPAGSQPGISFIRNGSVLTIRVTTLRYDPALKSQVNANAEATVKLRN